MGCAKWAVMRGRAPDSRIDLLIERSDARWSEACEHHALRSRVALPVPRSDLVVGTATDACPYDLETRRLHGRGWFAGTDNAFTSIVPAIAFLLPLVALTQADTPPVWNAAMLAALLYIAIFASLIGFLLWLYGVSAIGPERAGQFVHLMPLFGAALAVLWLGETVAPAQLVGAGCVCAGIVLVQRGAPAGA